MNFSAGSLNSKSPSYRSKYDDRKGLGYGLSKEKFHKSRKSQSNFPYVDKDEHSDDFQEESLTDEELDVFVKKTNAAYYPSDSLKKNDPFYMFAGNTSAKSLASESMNVNPKSMSPLPRTYSSARKATAVSGGTSSLPFPGPTTGFRTSIRPTGTKKGFSFAPPSDNRLLSITDEPSFSIRGENSDENHVNNLRKLVRHVLKGKLYAKKSKAS